MKPHGVIVLEFLVAVFIKMFIYLVGASIFAVISMAFIETMDFDRRILLALIGLLIYKGFKSILEDCAVAATRNGGRYDD